MLRWDAAPGVLDWVVRLSERRDPRGGYVVLEERELPAGTTSVEVPLGANALRIHLLGRGRGGSAGRAQLELTPGGRLGRLGGLARPVRAVPRALARRWVCTA